MQRLKNKKGFTLAELLIVVAIIAVLTAIAVPLFVSSLSKAQKATDDANIRALRGFGASVILMVDNETGNPYKDFYADVYEADESGVYKMKTPAKGFLITATLSDNGAFTITAIGEATGTAGEEKVEKKDGTTTVTAVVPNSSVAKAGA